MDGVTIVRGMSTLSTLAVALLLMSSEGFFASSDSSVTRFFEDQDNIFSDFGLHPSQEVDLVDVEYGGRAVETGESLAPSQVSTAPSLTWPSDDDCLYFVVFHDLDAPSRNSPTAREWQHWAVANLPGSDVTAGDVLAEYYGPTPPAGSGPHRYVFLVFKQAGQLDLERPALSSDDTDHRGGQKVMQFVEKYGLDGPVAANYFLSES